MSRCFTNTIAALLGLFLLAGQACKKAAPCDGNDHERRRSMRPHEECWRHRPLPSWRDDKHRRYESCEQGPDSDADEHSRERDRRMLQEVARKRRALRYPDGPEPRHG